MWTCVCVQEQRRPAAMAGKGRGVGAFTFNIDALGIGRGNMPEARVGPSPLFPVSTEHSLLHTHTSAHTHKQYVRLHFNITNSPLMLKRVEVKLYWSDFRRDLFERGR